LGHGLLSHLELPYKGFEELTSEYQLDHFRSMIAPPNEVFYPPTIFSKIFKVYA